MVEYTYDAWGRCRASNTSIIGELNPYRYRGYYWDKDDGKVFNGSVDSMRRVHDKIRGQNFGYNELIDFIKKL